MALNSVYRVRVFTRVAQQVGLTVLHYQQFSQVNNDITDAQFNTQWLNNHAGLWKGCMSLNADFRGITRQRILPTPPSPQVADITQAGPGLVATDLLPREVSSIITFRTQFAGRAYRGRAYIPFPAENANQADGTVNPAHVANLQLLATQLATNMTVVAGANTSQYQLVIWHRSNNTWTPVSSAEARPYWASQRRRGDYGAANVSI